MTKVVIIEDNNDIRENVVEILSLSGYTVFEADNGKKGAEIVIENQPDIILCDIMMPGMDGYGVFELLHSNEETKAIPFIFITAKSERIDIRKGMEMGADDYLTKPFDDVELINAIESRLKKKQIQQDFYSKSFEKIKELILKQDGLGLLKEALDERKVKSVKKRHVIYDEGESVKGIWLLLSGKVKTIKMTEEGRELLTGIFEPDDFLAINALFAEGVYLDSAVAIEDSQLILFPIAQFEEFISQYPDVGEKFIRILSNQVREKEDHLMQLAYNSVRKRVAEGLLKFYRQQGNNDKSVTVSRNNLAAMTGTAQETVSRTLTDFCDEGLIKKEGSTIIILNEQKLERLKN
ncbi:response regulator [Flavobacterium phycosphaerae]|uniref:response regulator n=1 Tax=Flavobacterium phycosphaerae TaxID=2697515 RepID=UPI001389D103|nr:response regulator [Flavobacterium phycosphaerae]